MILKWPSISPSLAFLADTWREVWNSIMGQYVVSSRANRNLNDVNILSVYFSHLTFRRCSRNKIGEILSVCKSVCQLVLLSLRWFNSVGCRVQRDNWTLHLSHVSSGFYSNWNMHREKWNEIDKRPKSSKFFVLREWHVCYWYIIKSMINIDILHILLLKTWFLQIGSIRIKLVLA